MKFNRICVFGLGYIGLPTASTFATQGLKVIGVDVNPRVVEILQNGGLHIHEPGLRTLVQAALSSGNLVISDQPQPADAFIIVVPTPFYEDKRADMREVTAAAEAIVPCLGPGNLVVLESTSQPSGDPYAQQVQYQVWQAQQHAYWQAQQPPPAAAAEAVRSGRGTGAAIAGIFLVLLGVWFLFREEISLDIGRAWPIMAVALGALMVIAAFIPRRRS